MGIKPFLLRKSFFFTLQSNHLFLFAFLVTIFWLLGGASSGVQAQMTGAVYPLKLSMDPGARYLVDQNNQPFFIVGEAAWSLIGQVSLEDAQLYLDDLAARGFNTVITTLVEGYYADNAPANYYGVAPYIPANDFSSPNDAYFAHADAVISYAASKGILVILSPNYLGCCSDGWRSVLENQNTDSDAANFGTYVGNRYKDFPNLIYAWGNDTNPDNTNIRTKINVMAAAAKGADVNHLHTYHALPEFSSLEIKTANNFSWIDFNSVYTYNPVQGEVAYNYDPDNNPNTPPPLPFFLFEAHYENDWAGKNALITRREGYVAVLTGASGYAYGNNPMWHMNGHPSWNPTDWHLHLNDEGRADMTHFQALFASRDWVHLIPDLSNTLVTVNKGSGEDYSAAAITADDSTAIIYFPSNKTITVAMNQISGTTANVWWFNPRDGTAPSGGTVATTGTHQFTPPTNNDWLLVLDNAALNLPAPGGLPLPTQTPTLPPTPTPIPSSTPTPIPTLTPTSTNTPSESLTPTLTPTQTSLPTLTPVPTLTPTPTNTSVPGTGFPTTGILDDFNRSNGPIGPNWSGQTSGYSIVSNFLEVGTTEDIYWNSTTYGSDQEAYITLTTIDLSGSEIGLILKSQSNSALTGMIDVLYNPVSKQIQVWTYSVSQGWVQRGTNLSITLVNGDQFGARATVSGVVEIYCNSVLLGTRSVTAWPSYAGGGYLGIFPLAASNTVLDNFGGGTKITAPTATPTLLPPTNTPTMSPIPPTSTNTSLPPTATSTNNSLTPTYTPTNTPVHPTTTPTFTPIPPTAPPTNTPTSPPTPTPVGGNTLYISSTTNGTAGGVSFADEDILTYNLTSGTWSLYIDGSDIGLGGTDINAFSILSDGSLLLSLDAATFTVPGLGTVEDRDIIRFMPTSVGATTAGTFAWYFDGSDVGLTASSEDIDSISFAPDGRLLISSIGNIGVPGVSGGDEDILAFTPTQLGSTTSGTWTLYFDGSDVGLNNAASEEINGLWVNPVNNELYLTTLGAFTVSGVSGDGADIFICTPGTLGSTTTCTFRIFWDGSLNGFVGEVADGIQVSP